MKFFFDTYAIIELLNGSDNYKKFSAEKILTGILNLGELYHHYLKHQAEKEGEKWCEILKPTAFNIDIDIIIEAMKMKNKYEKRKLSFIDCVGYITAKRMNLLFLTGDKEFEDLPNVEFVK